MDGVRKAEDYATDIIMNIEDKTDKVEAKFAQIDNRFHELLEDL